MMSGMPLETCCAVNERWNNKFYYKVASCWLFLLSPTMMHGSMNIKLTTSKFQYDPKCGAFSPSLGMLIYSIN